VREKPLVWAGSSLTRLKGFPAPVRRQAGHDLFLVQRGIEPGDWKPMRSVGPGVFEIRIHAGGEYRVLYVARFEEAVYVLHAFEKKTQQTRKADIELAKKNLLWITQNRRKR